MGRRKEVKNVVNESGSVKRNVISEYNLKKMVKY